MRARFSFSVLALVGAMAVSPTAHAGDVVSKNSGGKLVLEGDDGANVLTIDQVGVPADSLRVTPGTGTTLDGAPTPQVFAATTGGKLYSLDLARGKELWQYDAGGSFTASPAIVDGRVLLGNSDGTLYCFGASLAKTIDLNHNDIKDTKSDKD